MVREGTAAVYTRHYKGRVCQDTDQETQGSKKAYKGTLKGGLKLTEDSREHRMDPVVGMVDDLVENEEINVKNMMKEHFQAPKHFGIHLSELETLNAAGVREDKPRDMSIIADMFD